MIDNGNSEGVTQILDTILVTSQVLNNLEVLLMTRIELDEKILQYLCLIIKSNFIKELSLNQCNLGDPNIPTGKLAEAFSYNSSLLAIEINSNKINDD